MSNPVLVNCLRGEVIENRHRGSIAVCDPRGRLIYSCGDLEALVYPRSSIKALQALPLVESGAARHFETSDIELALACSSHNAESAHTEVAAGWLRRLDLDETALECGAHAPLALTAANQLTSRGAAPSRIHNNCSGKHTGMLATARFLNESISGYIDREHPVQQRWMAALGEMADVDIQRLPWNLDGCGIPVIAMPLRSMATAFARMAVPDDLPAHRADAVDWINQAIASHPYMIAGAGRLCTEVMQLTGRRVLIKTGADGVYTATLREQGLGLALKIDDGTREAAEVAVLAALQSLKALSSDEVVQLAERCRMPIVNTRGITTGYRQPANFELARL